VKRSKSAVIRNVPDKLPLLPERVNSPVIRLLYVGRLDPVKGIDFLLSVLDKLSNKYTFQLEVLGRGPSEAALQARYALSAWVKFHGFVSSDEVAITMAQADLFCMPSLWAEVYGLVTAQALQIGIPVIGSRTGGTVELVRDGETGVLVEPGDKAAWYAAFEQIFSNLSLLETWRQNTLKYKYQFDEEVIGDAYNKFSMLHHQA
jgi:glycosyltransferase involved in cell wall biosynthesis